MNELKLPQAFYDLISRIIPGFTGICFFTFAVDKKVGELPTLLFGNTQNVLNSSVTIILVVGLIVAYLLGQIIALLSDLFEKYVAKRAFPFYFNEIGRSISNKSNYPKDVKDFIETEAAFKSNNSKQIAKLVYIWYDWLRINREEAGARCAKVRAEYRMHAGIAVIMILTLAIHFMSTWLHDVKINYDLVIISFVLFFLFAWAHARAHRMFEWSIINQYYAAKK